MYKHEHFYRSNRAYRRWYKQFGKTKQRYTNNGRRRKFDVKTLTAFFATAGMTSKDAYRVASLFVKWYQSNGPAWTNSRIKELRLWFEKYLAGEEYIPNWFAHTSKGTPKGVLGTIFRLPLEGGILVLSANTLLFDDPHALSRETLEKQEKALRGNGFLLTKEGKQNLQRLFKTVSLRETHPWNKTDNSLRLPVPRDIPFGKTIPVNHGVDGVRCAANDEATRLQLYGKSWEDLPEQSVEFLMDEGHLDWIPIKAIGNEYQLELNNRSKAVGRLGVVVEPQMKMRFPAMTNAITQQLLEPLGTFWYGQLRHLSTDCTFNQFKGIDWVQSQLAKGVTLASVDMTSASDLLDLDACIEVVNTTYFNKSRQDEQYVRHIGHFHDIARGLWWDNTAKKYAQWAQGQPLGSYPSFALMALTNNALCRLACRSAGLPMDSFRVLGDDVIIDARAAEYYCEYVALCGGEINHLKTVTSSKLVEFAGRVITATSYCNKAIHLADFSDDSFMSYASMLGPKARKYLQPRQRKVWDQLKYVPGIVSDFLGHQPYSVNAGGLGVITLDPVNGPWMKESFGYPLSLRYEWYLSCIQRDDVVPDPLESETVGENLYAHTTRLVEVAPEWVDYYTPWVLNDEDYQSPLGSKLPSGDPRKWGLTQGTLLEQLEELVSSEEFTPFLSFLESKRSSQSFVSNSEQQS